MKTKREETGARRRRSERRGARTRDATQAVSTDKRHLNQSPLNSSVNPPPSSPLPPRLLSSPHTASSPAPAPHHQAITTSSPPLLFRLAQPRTEAPARALPDCRRRGRRGAARRGDDAAVLALQPQRAQLADVPQPRGQDLRGAPHRWLGHPQERQHGEPLPPLRRIHQRRRLPRRRARPRRRRRGLRIRRLRPGVLLRQPRAQEG